MCYCFQHNPDTRPSNSPARAERRLLAVDVTVLVLFLLLADLLLEVQLVLKSMPGLHREAATFEDVKVLMELLRCTMITSV